LEGEGDQGVGKRVNNGRNSQVSKIKEKKKNNDSGNNGFE